MKKAAILTHLPLYQVGGIERFNLYLKQLFEDYGFQIDVYCLSDVRQTPFRKLICRFIPPLNGYYFLSRLIKNKKQEYNFIITNNNAGGVLRTGKTDVYNITHGVWAGGIKNLKKIDKTAKITIGMRQELFLERLSKLGKKGIIAVSKSVRDDLMKYYGINSVIINNCVNIKHFKKNNSKELREKYGIKKEEIVGLYAGRWSFPDKRVHCLLNIIKERKNIKWIIATNTKINISEYGNIILLNNIDYNYMPEVYSIADFSLQLSIHEGFSYFTLESIACSLPMITTKVGGTDEVFAEPLLQDLLLQSWHNSEEFYKEICDKIDYLVKNKDYHTSVSKRLREIAEERFSLEVWRKKMAEFFRLDRY